MAFINNDVLDAALAVVVSDTTDLHICSDSPTDFASAASASLGVVSNPSFTGPLTPDAGGRSITVDAITNGDVTASGTATHFALVDASDSRLLAAGVLDASVSVSEGNTFTLSAFDIRFPAL